MLGVEQQGRHLQVGQPRRHARPGVVVGGVREAVARSHEVIVELQEGADLVEPCHGVGHGPAGGHERVESLQVVQEVVAVDPVDGSIDLPLGTGQVDRRADRGHRGHAGIDRLGREAEHHVPAHGVADHVEAPIAGQLRAGEGGVEVRGEAGVVVILAATVRAPQVDAEAGQARGLGGLRPARHVMAVDASAQPVDQDQGLVALRDLPQAPGQAHGADLGIVDRRLPDAGLRAAEGAHGVAEPRGDGPEVAGQEAERHQGDATPPRASTARRRASRRLRSSPRPR